VSGRERDVVQAGLGDIRGLGLAAEHGLYFRWPKVIISQHTHVCVHVEVYKIS
jgi:trehalose-6-phosphatase